MLRTSKSNPRRGLEDLEIRTMLTSVGFVSHELLPRDIQAPALVEPFDVDGDGDTDLLAIENDILVWFPNTDGSGSFGPREILTGVVNGGALDLADLDGDKLTDIVLATHWLKNLGSGDYVTLQYESFDVQDEYGDVPPHRIVAADVDGDADLDLVRMDHIGFLAFGISWAENDRRENSRPRKGAVLPWSLGYHCRGCQWRWNSGHHQFRKSYDLAGGFRLR